MCSGITRSRLFERERASRTMISKVNLSAFIYRLCHANFYYIEENLHERVCKQMQINSLPKSLCIIYIYNINLQLPYPYL